MKGIGHFLDGFKNKAALQVRNHFIIAEIIKKVTKFDLDPKDLEFSRGIVTIKASPLVKNEIFIKKQAILKQITEKIVGVKIQDIK